MYTPSDATLQFREEASALGKALSNGTVSSNEAHRKWKIAVSVWLDSMRDSHADLLPPWRAFPEIPRGSIGWNMGDGEVYIEEWHSWYRNLGREDRRAYRRRYRPPFAWWDHYIIASGSRWIWLPMTIWFLQCTILLPVGIVYHMVRDARSSDAARPPN